MLIYITKKINGNKELLSLEIIVVVSEITVVVIIISMLYMIACNFHQLCTNQ